MQCPFRYRRPTHRYSMGVDGEFMDRVYERESAAERWLNKNYPTCWDKFLHWLGWR